MNIWLIIRLCWLIPVIIFSLYTVFAIFLIIFIDWFIDMELLKIVKSETEEGKKEHRLNLLKLLEIKVNAETIKRQLKEIFRL